MEEILRELIKTTQEKGPQNKQFYSNLSITKPIHDNLEIQSGLGEGITYLQSRFNPSSGFQSNLYTSRNCAIECSKVYPNFKLSSKETVTSVLALDLLFNPHDEELITPCFQEAVFSSSSFPNDMQDALQDFIVPSSGLSTFNVFKQSPTPNPSPDEASQRIPRSLQDDFEFDSGNDSPSPTLMNHHLHRSQNHLSLFSADQFPDDINTTAITLSVLLHQGLLKPKPVESVVRWLISNAFTFTKLFKNKEEKEEEEEKIAFKMFPSLDEQGSCDDDVCDPVALANFLHLMYLLDISHESLLKSCEELLLLTLKNSIASSKTQTVSTASKSEASAPSSSSSQLLGNTLMISSDNEEEKIEATATQTQPESSQYSYFSHSILHHSPDSLLYFLSRSLAITKFNNRASVPHFKRELLELLDTRLGTTVDSVDLAMRICAGVYLGVLNNGDGCKKDNEQRLSMQYLRMSNLLQKEFELLVSLQNMDGSWPPDSIVEIGVLNNRPSLDDDENGGEVEHVVIADDEEKEITIVGYLGGKELSTLFAVKAISAYVNCKKYGIQEEQDEESESEGEDLEVHYLY